MYTQRFDPRQNPQMGPDGYDGTVAYAKVKRAQLVLMHEWVRRLEGMVWRSMPCTQAGLTPPGSAAGVPGFAKVMGPILRTPDQGADTAVWLAVAPEAATTSGRFWLDRRPRWEHKVPWTHLSEDAFAAAGTDLWAWCAVRCGWDGLA